MGSSGYFAIYNWLLYALQNEDGGPQPRPDPVPVPVAQRPVNMADELKKVKMQSVTYALTQVKTMAGSNAPDASIMMSLDMLVAMAEESDHPDLALYQNLRSQASRMQEKICIKGLCLEVLCAKENDKVSNAVQKMLREAGSRKPEKVEKKEEPASPQPTAPMPPQNSVQPFPTFQQYGQMLPQQQMPYANQGFNGYMGQAAYQPQYPQSFRGRQRKRGGFNQQKAVCHFCGIEGHIVRDCQALKKLRESTQK